MNLWVSDNSVVVLLFSLSLMNGDQALYENQVLSKKFNKIDEEPQTGKKGKKNRKQKQQMVDVEE